jgi:hypothetical protein
MLVDLTGDDSNDGLSASTTVPLTSSTQGSSALAASSSSSSSSAASKFWTSVLSGPVAAPKCQCGEDTVERTTLKENANLGKKFYVCARPQGLPGAPGARCNFFRWADEHRRDVESRRAGNSGGRGSGGIGSRSATPDELLTVRPRDDVLSGDGGK